MAAIAQVEPLTTSRAVRGPFDYSLPDQFQEGVNVGSLLLVPFGRQKLVGVVVGLADHSSLEPDKLAAPLSALENRIPAYLVSLASWIAEEYCSTFARALALVLPPGTAAGTRSRTALVAELTSAGAAALRDPDPPTASTNGAGPDGPRLTPRQRAVLERLLHKGPLPATGAGADHGALRRLEARGLITLEPRARPRRPQHLAVGAQQLVPPPLNPAQAQALERISGAIDRHEHEQLLLHGVTGSGKTEVYLRGAERALAAGRSAIVLVPEIALTPQIVARFTSRFGDTVAVLHSRLSAGERHDEWLRLRRGEARVCVGPRSAVFAPLEDLGLIVLDEEHDASYKHEGDPRYDARLVAARRARISRAVLVAGSATPRPETFHRLARLSLPERVDGQALPPVELLDMREAPTALHPRTAHALAGMRRAGRKAIVLLNRRGWSNFLSCRSCGHVWSCPSCDVTLVLHRAGGYVACHHCGHREFAPQQCTACGSVSVARHGMGTERLERELAQALGDERFPIFRLDSDVALRPGRGAAVLHAFERAPAGVLVGTQMVAKGHDFPDVALAVVLDADATLRFPDFRAEERTFSLVAQLAGRAGRGGLAPPRGGRPPTTSGRVLVQTMGPEASCLRFAARHDADGFLRAELERRRALGYPPFTDLIRVVCSAADSAPAERAAAVLAERIVARDTDLLGPAPLFRLRGRERVQIVIKTTLRSEAVRAVGGAVETTATERAHRGVSFAVDVDPQ